MVGNKKYPSLSLKVIWKKRDPLRTIQKLLTILMYGFCKVLLCTHSTPSAQNMPIKEELRPAAAKEKGGKGEGPFIKLIIKKNCSLIKACSLTRSKKELACIWSSSTVHYSVEPCQTANQYLNFLVWHHWTKGVAITRFKRFFYWICCPKLGFFLNIPSLPFCLLSLKCKF